MRRGSTCSGFFYLIFIIVGAIWCVAQTILDAIQKALAYALYLVVKGIQANAHVISDPIFWLVLCAGVITFVAVSLIVIRRRSAKSLNVNVSQTKNSLEYSVQEDPPLPATEVKEGEAGWRQHQDDNHYGRTVPPDVPAK